MPLMPKMEMNRLPFIIRNTNCTDSTILLHKSELGTVLVLWLRSTF